MNNDRRKSLPYNVLEKAINSLPEAALVELTHYVEYLASIYSQKENQSVTNKINNFLKKNPDCFDEFKTMEKESLQKC